MKLLPYSKSLSAAVIIALNTGCQSLSPAPMNSDNDPNSVVSKETRRDQARRLFAILDIDNDGVISQEEARAGFRYIIASYDRPKTNEMLAASSTETAKTKKYKPKRRPTAEDADRAFEALFVKGPTKVGNGLTEAEFEKLVVKASDNPELDPFVAFL